MNDTPHPAAALPPFSGDDPTCAMCGWACAFTEYQPPMPRGLRRFNGRTDVHGPLPERLERCCTRCGYRWDEALAEPAPHERQSLAAAADVTPAPMQAYNGDVRELLARCPETKQLRPGELDAIADRLLDQADIYLKQPIPPDTVRTPGHQPTGHVQEAAAARERTPADTPLTRADTVRPPSGQERPDIMLPFPLAVRPAVIRLTALGADETPTKAMVIHLPEPGPFTTRADDPWTVEGRLETARSGFPIQYQLDRPNRLPAERTTVLLDLSLPTDDAGRFLTMCRIPSSGLAPLLSAFGVELWEPLPHTGQWGHYELGPFTAVMDLEISNEFHVDRTKLRCAARFNRHTRLRHAVTDNVPPPSGHPGIRSDSTPPT